MTLPCIVLFFQTQLSTLGDDDGETQNKNKSKSRTKKPALERKTKRKALGSVHSASRIALSDVKLNESQRRSHSAENPSASSSAFKSAKDVSARQTKAMALEAGIRRLQKDVERHRATEASLRAALDAETEVWKFDCSVSDEEELHEKLAASLDVQAQMQEELARELTLRITAEEASEQAKKDLDSLQRDFDSLKDDVAQRATASKERDNLFEELRRETEARRTAEVAYEEAQSRVQTLEKTLAKQRSELRSRASENSQEITSSLETAKAEATQARARVEETLAALTRAKQAERGARKSELATANAARAELKEMKRRLAKESEKRQKAEAEAQTIQMKLEEHINGDRRDDSSKIAEAIQSKEMAEAQASMLRSCLEDTEEMLEESRATARTLEAKLKETQVMQKSDPSVDEKMQTLLSRAEEAEQSVSAARLIAKHAEEGLATARHDAEDMAQYLKNLVAEHEAAISRLHAESKEKDESIEALRRAHDETLSKSKVLDEMLIRAEQTKRQLNEQLSKANAEVKTLTETRVQHDDSAVHERLASMQQKLNSVEDAKSGAEASLQLIQEEVKQLQLKLAEKEAKDAGATVPVPIKVTPTDDMVVQTDPPPQLIDICTQMDASIDVRVKLSADIEEKSKALEDVQLRFIAAEVKHNADLAAMQQLCDELKSKADASAHSANELESKLVWATQRSSDLESELVTLREEAKLSLDVKVKEVVAATQAARDALLGKSAAETEIQQLKHMLSKYEEVASSNDEMEIDVVELREALSNAAVTIRKQEASLSELTVRLEAAEAASADGEAQNALLRDELAAKLEKAEESLKTARAENAKHEWKVSVLTSDLDMQKSWTAAKEREVSELNEALVMVRAEVQSATSEATAKLSSTTNELSEARQTIDKFRRELDEACQLSDRLASELDISKQKLLTATVDAAKFKKDFEAKCVEAETQANEAAAVLSAFKRDANATLKQKTDELVALSGVATDTKAAKDCAETELRRLRQAIAQHEANVSTDEALRVEVIELREALSDALEAHKNQRTSLSELTVRLEAAEAASADGEAQNALLRDELAAKLEKAEESLKTARAENAKHEWTISELKSQVQVGEVKLKDATSKVTSTSAKLAESEDSLAVSIRELKESRRRVTQIAADLERVQHKHEKSIEASYQTEMKLAAAEQRAAWAEAALVAFKQERLHDLEVKSQQVKSVETSHADNTLEEFKKIANVSLERRTTEMLLATRVASEATAAKEAAEAEILRMKQTLEAVQAKTAADVHLQSDVRDLQAILVQSTKMLHQRLEAVDEAVATKEAGNKLVSQLASIESLAAQEAARTEVNRLTCLVADAEKENGASKEKIHKLEAEVHILQSALAEARKAHDSQLGLQDELRSQLIALQLSHDAREKDHEEAAAKLRHQFDEKLEASMRELKETTDRAAKAMASKELADAEVIRLVALCSELEKRDEAAIEDAVKAKTAELTKRITGLQKDHDEALSLCDSLRLQLDTVAAAAEKANELNDRCIQEAEVDASAASIVMHEMSDQLAQLNSEVTAAKANITSLSAVRESLEDELLSMEVEIKVALEERTQAMQEVSELKKSISGLGKVRDDLVVAHSEMRKLKEAEEREVELQLRAENAEQRERELHTKIISTQSALRELRLENGSMETRLACGAAELSSAKEEAVQLREEVKKIQLAALDASASDTNVKSKINAVKEALKDSEAALEIERLAREAAEARVSALEQRLSLLNSTAGEFTQQLDEGSNEEIAQLLDVAQEEVERSRAECQIAKKELRGAKSRVRQLEEEVLRLQKHEHALHALLGSA